MLNEGYASVNSVKRKGFCEQPVVIDRGVNYDLKELKRRSFFKVLTQAPKQYGCIYQVCMITASLDPVAALLSAAAEDRHVCDSVCVHDNVSNIVCKPASASSKYY